MKRKYIPLNTTVLYEADTDGNIYNSTTGRKLKTFKSKRGYMLVSLRTNNKPKTYSVHGVIAKTFIGGHYETIDHVNGIKTDNRLSNLVPMSRYNNQHKHIMEVNPLYNLVNTRKDRWVFKRYENGKQIYSKSGTLEEAKQYRESFYGTSH